MKPTPAQIEAAKKAFVQTLNIGGSQIEAIIAAITAAAEVGEQDK